MGGSGPSDSHRNLLLGGAAAVCSLVYFCWGGGLHAVLVVAPESVSLASFGFINGFSGTEPAQKPGQTFFRVWGARLLPDS